MVITQLCTYLFGLCLRFNSPNFNNLIKTMYVYLASVSKGRTVSSDCKFFNIFCTKNPKNDFTVGCLLLELENVHIKEEGR